MEIPSRHLTFRSKDLTRSDVGSSSRERWIRCLQINQFCSPFISTKDWQAKIIDIPRLHQRHHHVQIAVPMFQTISAHYHNPFLGERSVITISISDLWTGIFVSIVASLEILFIVRLRTRFILSLLKSLDIDRRMETVDGDMSLQIALTSWLVVSHDHWCLILGGRCPPLLLTLVPPDSTLVDLNYILSSVERWPLIVAFASLLMTIFFFFFSFYVHCITSEVNRSC